MEELMYDINAGLIAVALLLIVLGAIEMGYRLGRRTQGPVTDEDAKAHVNATQSSTLGILALLLAFTFSLALQRFDTRSDAVVDEANAIGTAYLRAQMLPGALGGEARSLLREYVDVRVEAGTVSMVEQKRWSTLTGRAGDLQNAPGERARRAAELDANHVRSGMFVQATNDLIDSFGRRDAAINRHVPEMVLFLLLGTFVITSAIVGYSGGVVHRRPPLVSFAMVALIVVLVFVILDLDRPRRGLIVVSERNLLDLQASMKAETHPVASPKLPASAPTPAPAASR